MSNILTPIIDNLLSTALSGFMSQAEQLYATQISQFKADLAQELPASGGFDLTSTVQDFVSKLKGQLSQSVESLVSKFNNEAQALVVQAQEGSQDPNPDELKTLIGDKVPGIVTSAIDDLSSKLQSISDGKLAELSADDDQIEEGEEPGDNNPQNPAPAQPEVPETQAEVQASTPVVEASASSQLARSSRASRRSSGRFGRK